MLAYSQSPKMNIKILPEAALAKIIDHKKRECMFCGRDDTNNIYFDKNYLLSVIHMDLNLYNNAPHNLNFMCEFHKLSYMAFHAGKKLRGKRVTKESFNV